MAPCFDLLEADQPKGVSREYCYPGQVQCPQRFPFSSPERLEYTN